MFPTFSEGQIKCLDEALGNLRDVMEEMANDLAEDKRNGPEIKEDDLTITVKMTEEEYRILLNKSLESLWMNCCPGIRRR